MIKERIKHHLSNIVILPEKLTSSDACRVNIVCHSCKILCETSVRNLIRKWSSNLYLCKSCHVKTYASNVNRIRKFKDSFTITKKFRQKCSESAKKLWSNAELREKISKAVSEDNKKNPAKTIARKKGHDAWMKKYGLKKLLEMRCDQKNKESIIETIFAQILTQNNIKYKQEHKIGYYKYDFYIPSHNMLIELNGEYWHKDSSVSDSAKATYASNLGYIVKCVWEQEFNEMGKIEAIICEWFSSEVKQIDFNFCNINIKSICNLDARKFLGQYHYLPAISKSGYHIGAFLNDKLIACITFSWVVRKQTAIRLGLTQAQVREVGRFCIATGYNKKNFASWFLSRTIKLYKKEYPQVKILISFADTTIHDGTIYAASNWTYTGETKPNYMYRSNDGYLVHKKTVWDRAKKLNMKECDYVSKNGYVKIRSKSKKRYQFDL